jgi:hypothetical protein
MNGATADQCPVELELELPILSLTVLALCGPVEQERPKHRALEATREVWGRRAGGVKKGTP